MRFISKLLYNKLKIYRDLEAKLITSKIVPRREHLSVCIIDDAPNYLEKKLSNLFFKKIDCIPDYKPIEEYHKYQLILCDIKGVGVDFNKKKQGLAYYEQIKKMYPEKVVILYTAYSPRDFGDVEEDAIIINKPIEPSDLANKLDSYSKRFWDPKTAWDYIEKKCIERSATHKDLAILEDMFVRSFYKSGDDLFKSALQKNNNNKSFNDYLRIAYDVSKVLFIVANEVFEK
jgi:hypothetical protein